MNKHPLAYYVNRWHALIGSFTDNKNFVHSKGTNVRINGLPYKSSSANGLSVPIITTEGNIDVDISFLFTPDVVDAVKRHMKANTNANYGKEAMKSISTQPKESTILFTTWYADDRIVGRTYRPSGKNLEIMCIGKSNLYPNGEGMIYQMTGEFYTFDAEELIRSIVRSDEFHSTFNHTAKNPSRISICVNEFTKPMSLNYGVQLKSEKMTTISDSSGSITDETSIVMPNVTKVKANKEIKVKDNSPTLTIPIVPIKAKKPKRPIYVASNTLFIGTKRINNLKQ